MSRYTFKLTMPLLLTLYKCGIGIFPTQRNMKTSQLISSVLFFLVLIISFNVSPAAAAAAEDFISCLQSNSNNISELIFTPYNSSLLPVWEVAVNNLGFNTTSSPKPSVIVTPIDENQVQTTLLCTKKHGYEIRIRCKGHDSEGLSNTADEPFVMLDLTNMKSVHMDIANRNAGVEGGLCPSVSVGGYTSGDGYGSLIMKYARAEDFVSCLQSKSNDISQLIFTPASSSFKPVWEVAVNNLRFNTTSTPKPSVIVTPIDENQIQTTLLCTKKHGYEIRIRSGGHDFEGLSYTANVPFVMLDLTNMRSVQVDVANRTAWVQGGSLLGDLYYAISQKTNTLYFPGGFCPSVGVGGYIGGGGYGSLIRKYGTAADNVVDVRFMDVNGNILNRESMGEDLFWAIRGGGVSSFGIVLAWKLRLVPVPELVTLFHVDITLEEGAMEIFHKYQYVFPAIDRNLMIRVTMKNENMGNTSKKTIRMSFDGLYLGTSDTLLPLLDQEFPDLNVTREICQEMRMVQSTIVFLGFPKSTSTEILVNGSCIIRLNSKSKVDYVRTPIPISGLQKIWKKMFENDESGTLFMQTFGGRMEDYSDTAIPFPHRAGVLYQFHQQIDFYDQATDSTPVSLQRISWLKSFNDLITPYVSKNPREAFLNYNDLDLGVGSATFEEASIWGERYWNRDNFKKLIRIKAIVDPENFFKHPQSIPVFSKSQSDM